MANTATRNRDQLRVDGNERRRAKSNFRRETGKISQTREKLTGFCVRVTHRGTILSALPFLPSVAPRAPSPLSTRFYMNVIVPLLCACLYASDEVATWSRFPPAAVCSRNWAVADRYVKELDCACELLAGWPADQLRERAHEARQLRDVWWALWWVAAPGDATNRELWAADLHRLVGTRAYLAGEWPGPMPSWHFGERGAGDSDVAGSAAARLFTPP